MMLDTKARSAASMTPYRPLIEVRNSGQTGFGRGPGFCGKVTRRETASASLTKTWKLPRQSAQLSRRTKRALRLRCGVAGSRVVVLGSFCLSITAPSLEKFRSGFPRQCIDACKNHRSTHDRRHGRKAGARRRLSQSCEKAKERVPNRPCQPP